jgi:hypothetical protein
VRKRTKRGTKEVCTARSDREEGEEDKISMRNRKRQKDRLGCKCQKECNRSTAYDDLPLSSRHDRV